MEKIAVIVVGLLILWSFQADARPSGAPNSACSTLVPRHSPNQVGNDSFPYNVDLSALVSGYEEGKSYRSKLCVFKLVMCNVIVILDLPYCDYDILY